MKDTEKTKLTKKKIVFYYLILAACILIIAAITVAVVFTVRGARLNETIDSGETEQPDDSDDGDDGSNTGNQDEDDDVKDTSTSTVFIFPLSDVVMSQKQDLWYDNTLDKYYMHRGVDFSADAGTEILAAIDGTVTAISVSDPMYGGVITLSHANGIVTVYRFVDPLENLNVGDTVSRGDVIATVAAATGVEIEEGSHLHFEVYKNGALTDPDEYLGAIK